MQHAIRSEKTRKSITVINDFSLTIGQGTRHSMMKKKELRRTLMESLQVDLLSLEEVT